MGIKGASTSQMAKLMIDQKLLESLVENEDRKVKTQICGYSCCVGVITLVFAGLWLGRYSQVMQFHAD